jgi:hypothetical protein
MSVAGAEGPQTLPGIAATKGGETLVCLAAGTAPAFEIVNEHCDVVLVGDAKRRGAGKATA